MMSSLVFFSFIVIHFFFLCAAYDVDEETVDNASVITSQIDEPNSLSPHTPTESVDELLQVICICFLVIFLYWNPGSTHAGVSVGRFELKP